MPDESRGWQRISQGRAMILDILHFARQMPMQPLVRQFDLGDLVRLRHASPVRVSWAILFMRGYALLSARHPELRQVYMRFPWPHIYQHDQTVCMLAISREYRDEERLFFGLFRTPEGKTLVELNARLDVFRQQPIDQTREYRGQLFLSRLPFPLRRLTWWLTTRVSGYVRVRHLGTFGITTVGNLGATSIHPPSVQSTMLTFGPIAENGQVRVTIVYDHRLMDGGAVARLLAELETILRGEVAQELRQLDSGSGKV
jgi:hypothetical protein